jgi:hypothetical protein
MKTKVTLNQEERLDILTDAIENGAIQYWACDFGAITIQRHEETGLITQAVFEAEDKDGIRHHYKVTAQTIQVGVEKLMREGFEVAGWIKSQILTGDNDVNTADAIIQAALFGELVYG